MFEALGRWSRPGFMLAGIGLLFGCAATILLELMGPGPVIWAVPALGVALALVAGAGAFLGLHRHLEPFAPRIAATSTLLASLTVGASLVAIATGVGAVTRGELPAGATFLAFLLALGGLLATSSLVSIAGWRTRVPPPAVAGGLAIAVASTLLTLVITVTSGAVPSVLLVALFGTWGLTLIGLSRTLPQRPGLPRSTTAT